MKNEMTDARKLTSDYVSLFAILFLVFLGALNLISRYYYFIFFAAILLVVTPNRKLRFDGTFLILLCFSLMLLLFDPRSQISMTNMLKPFTYPLCYLIGMCMFSVGEDHDLSLALEEKRTSVIIYVISGGVMLHFVLNMITNWGIEDRDVIDFWTKEDLSATGQATLACLMIAVSVTFIFSNVGRAKKIIAIMSLVVILTYNLMLAGRTIFMLILIAMSFALMYTLYVNKISSKSLKVIIAVIMIAVILVALYLSNAFGLKQIIESSNFYDRFFDGSNNKALDEDGRLEAKLLYLGLLPEYPFGGGKIYDIVGQYAHDLYLDTYSNAGIFALLMTIAYICSSLIRMLRCMKRNVLTFETGLLISSVYLVCNVQFWLEPILDGMPWLLASYCLIDGAVARLLLKRNDMYVGK